jgi:hypothetical protein
MDTRIQPPDSNILPTIWIAPAATTIVGLFLRDRWVALSGIRLRQLPWILFQSAFQLSVIVVRCQPSDGKIAQKIDTLVALSITAGPVALASTT